MQALLHILTLSTDQRVLWRVRETEDVCTLRLAGVPRLAAEQLVEQPASL
jgi:hypothetical protein